MATGHDVIALATGHAVVAPAAAHHIVTGFAKHEIVAHPAVQHVIFGRPHQIVVARTRDIGGGLIGPWREQGFKDAHPRRIFGGGVVRRVLAGWVVRRVLAGWIVRRVLAGRIVRRVLAGWVVRRVFASRIVRRVLAGRVVRRVLAGWVVRRVLAGWVVRRVLAGRVVRRVVGGGRGYGSVAVKRRNGFFVLVDRLDNTRMRTGIGRVVIFRDRCVQDRDGAKQILVMGTTARTLIGKQLNDGVVRLAIAVGVFHADFLDNCCMAINDDGVALVPVEIRDCVIADTVDPVVVHIIVLARDTHPVDRTVVIDVPVDDVEFGVDQGLEEELVRALAARQHVIRCHIGLGRVDHAGIEIDLVVRVVGTVEVLGDFRFPVIGKAHETVVAGTAIEDVLAMTAIEFIIAVTALKRVVAITAKDSVVAAAAIQRVVSGTAVDVVIAAFARNRVVADRRCLCHCRNRCGGEVARTVGIKLCHLVRVQGIGRRIATPEADTRNTAFEELAKVFFQTEGFGCRCLVRRAGVGSNNEWIVIADGIAA